jgi:hypothetical protein
MFPVDGAAEVERVRCGQVEDAEDGHGTAEGDSRDPTSPGSTVVLELRGVCDLHAEPAGKDYPNLRPGLEEEGTGTLLTPTDPFGNRLRCHERNPDEPAS